MATHSSTLAWKTPWSEEPGRLQSMGLRRVRDDFTFTFTFHFHALEKEMATHSCVLAWRIPGTAERGGLPSVGSQSQIQLKQLSSSSTCIRKAGQSPQVREGHEARTGVEVRGKMGRRVGSGLGSFRTEVQDQVSAKW